MVQLNTDHLVNDDSSLHERVKNWIQAHRELLPEEWRHDEKDEEGDSDEEW